MPRPLTLTCVVILVSCPGLVPDARAQVVLPRAVPIAPAPVVPIRPLPLPALPAPSFTPTVTVRPSWNPVGGALPAIPRVEARPVVPGPNISTSGVRKAADAPPALPARPSIRVPSSSGLPPTLGPGMPISAASGSGGPPPQTGSSAFLVWVMELPGWLWVILLLLLVGILSSWRD